MLARPTPRRRISVIGLACAAACIFAGPAAADLDTKAIGYDDLVARLGADTPDGTGIIAGHTEAPNGQGNWAPNEAHNQFQGKTFIYSPPNPQDTSGHATTVGRHYYGNLESVAPGITTIYAWEVNNWLNTVLRMNQGNTPPAQIEADILNNSWIGTFGSNALNNQALRRVDFLINDQGVIVTGGVNNNAGWSQQNILLSHMYNGIAVGRSDGAHNAGVTFNGIDGPARMKPEIVAPDNATSWTTGIISGCVALLRETARGLGPNPNADRPEVIKAVLLGGSTHRDAWTNMPDETGPSRGVTSTPLDAVFGVDQVNINTSHLILTAGEQDGTLGQHGSTNHAGHGWDLATIEAEESVYYRFEIASTADEVVVLTTWNRTVPIGFSSFEIPNINIELFACENDQLQSLRGSDDTVFASGNVASISAADNIEHLYIEGLAPGTYVLEVSRTSDPFGAWDVATAWVTPETPASSPATLTGVAVVNGSHLGGGLPELLASDDAHYHTLSGFGTTFLDAHNGEIVVNANTSTFSPTTLDIAIEQRIDEPAGSVQVRLFNWNTGAFEQIDTYPVTDSDAVTMTTCFDAEDYVNSGGDIDVSIKHSVFVPFFAFTFESFFDQVEILVR